jgi:hypothetical protein
VCGCVGKDSGIKYSNYYEYYQELLPMVEDIYNGVDIISTYNKLEPTKKLIACMITCARLASQLDKFNPLKLPKDKIEFPPCVGYVGKFIGRASHENTLVAIRSQITLDRIGQHNLDEHPDWAATFTSISSRIGDE